ncbi:hypothetical protein [Qipengyuania sp.]|uniref:hypothetical protein n=1 Tax=Qipengyuania sp. TaxID=2004515 RepID=UPI0035C7E6DF
MARHRLDSIHDFTRRAQNARITCDNPACGHVTDASAVLMMGDLGPTRARWPIERLEEKMRCSRCGHLGAAIVPCEIKF